MVYFTRNGQDTKTADSEADGSKSVVHGWDFEDCYIGHERGLDMFNEVKQRSAKANPGKDIIVAGGGAQ